MLDPLVPLLRSAQPSRTSWMFGSRATMAVRLISLLLDGRCGARSICWSSGRGRIGARRMVMESFPFAPLVVNYPGRRRSDLDGWVALGRAKTGRWRRRTSLRRCRRPRYVLAVATNVADRVVVDVAPRGHPTSRANGAAYRRLLPFLAANVVLLVVITETYQDVGIAAAIFADRSSADVHLCGSSLRQRARACASGRRSCQQTAVDSSRKRSTPRSKLGGRLPSSSMTIRFKRYSRHDKTSRTRRPETSTGLVRAENAVRGTVDNLARCRVRVASDRT